MNRTSKFFLGLALILAMTVTGMAQTVKVVKSSDNTPSQNETTQSSGGFWAGRPYIKGARFNAYFDFGFSIGGYSRPVYTTGGNYYDTKAVLFGMQVFNPTLGVRIFDYGFVGVQVGLTDVEMLFSKASGMTNYGYITERVNMYTHGYPIMIDLRGFFPINKDFHPYIEYAFGWSPEFIFCESENSNPDWTYEYNGWFNKTRVGVGIDIRRLSLGLGWNRNWGYNDKGSSFKRDYFYMKVGIKLGRRE